MIRFFSDIMQSILPMDQHANEHNNSIEAGLVCEKDTVTVAVDTCIYGQYQCDDGTCLLNLYTCDGSHDCPDGSDEKNCTHVCHFFERDFWDGRDCFEKCVARDCSCSAHYFQCTIGKCVPWSFVCNGKDDCKDFSDEIHCSYTILNNVKVIEVPITDHLRVTANQRYAWDTDFTLMEGRIIPRNGCATVDGVGECGRGSRECFPKSALCLFEKQTSNGIRYCSQGGHLLSCQTFECPTMFKCPESYCIPLFAVCNGDSNCPSGEDEVGCANRQCPGLLLCVKDNICVHPNNVMDGEVQCPINMDDEQLHQGSKCPSHCDCKGHSINCATVNMFNLSLPVPNHLVLNLNLSNTRLIIHNIDFKNYTSLLSLDLSKNKIAELLKGIFRPISQLMFLHFDHNLINILPEDSFGGLKQLRLLNILHNPIVSIESDAFSNLKSIEILDLSNIGIYTVMPFSFNGLEKCSVLSLLKNNISVIFSNTFSGMDQLRILDLRENPVEVISRDVFARFDKLNILVPFGQFCCFISVDHCEAPLTHALSSCQGYIPDKRWSIYLCVVTGMILILNLPAGALNIRIVNTAFSKFLVILQATSNTLSIVPLASFILVDHMLYHGLLFSYSDIRLKELPACLATSFLFALCFYTFIAVSATDILYKYIIIAHPLKTKEFESSKMYPVLAFLFVPMTLALSFLAIINLSTGELQASNSSCTAFGHERNDHIALVIILVLCYCTLCLVFMISITLLTINTLLFWGKADDLRHMGNMKAIVISRNRTVALNLLLKAVGQSLAPVIFILFGILDLADTIASVDMGILVTMFVFPVIPVINPILNTLLSRAARLRLLRLFYPNTS